jgi:hypothetical protein
VCDGQHFVPEPEGQIRSGACGLLAGFLLLDSLWPDASLGTASPYFRRSIEVAQLTQLNGPATRATRTPLPAAGDSDDVVLALETARALEARGDVREAARWLRRAAEQAESQGNDVRVLLFAHVAADLTASPRRPLAPAPPPGRRQEPSDSSEPTIRQSDFSMPMPPANSVADAAPDPSLRTIPDDDSSPTMVPPAPSATVPRSVRDPALPPSVSIVCQLSISPDVPSAEPGLRLGAIRVAIKKTGAKNFSVEQLAAGQELPAGTTEGMLVVARKIEG